jgi:hypothetical protein
VELVDKGFDNDQRGIKHWNQTGSTDFYYSVFESLSQRRSWAGVVEVAKFRLLAQHITAA